jgi:hypothetical protein
MARATVRVVRRLAVPAMRATFAAWPFSLIVAMWRPAEMAFVRRLFSFPIILRWPAQPALEG